MKSVIFNCSKVKAKVKIFEKWVKLQGQGEEVKFGGTLREDLVTRNTPVKYETHIPTHAKVIDKVKVLADRWTALTQQKIYTLETLFIRA